MGHRLPKIALLILISAIPATAEVEMIKKDRVELNLAGNQYRVCGDGLCGKKGEVEYLDNDKKVQKMPKEGYDLQCIDKDAKICADRTTKKEKDKGVNCGCQVFRRASDAKIKKAQDDGKPKKEIDALRTYNQNQKKYDPEYIYKCFCIKPAS